MPHARPRLRGWWRVFGHPTDEWASAYLVSTVFGTDDIIQSRAQHDAEADSGTHEYTEACPFCVEDYVRGSGTDSEGR